MTKLTEEELLDLAENAAIATICTSNEDGTIHAVPIWYRYRDGVYLMATPRKSKKTDNLRRDNRVSLSLSIHRPGDEPSSVALIYGTAEIDDGSLEKLIPEARFIMEKYVDDEGIQQRLEGVTEGVASMLCVTPTKTVAYHP
jgi:predicted pyridoxine 5'-phosphate oxidase superfamily flavin-nucleotide-binding protein